MTWRNPELLSVEARLPEWITSCTLLVALAWPLLPATSLADSPRERISINQDWKFFKYASPDQADNLIYDVRPSLGEATPEGPPNSAEEDTRILKPWILPSGNPLLPDSRKHHVRPAGNPGGDFPFVQSGFDDSGWQQVQLPHDWAIAGPFMEGHRAKVGGGMGRLPSPGVAWYRKELSITASDEGRRIFLDVDGAMSYAMVWLNGQLVGGWPYGYSSWRLDLTPHVRFGGENQLAIRLDNPPESSRWYPGGGIYRNVWLTKTDRVHVAHWGVQITTPEVTDRSAEVDVAVTIDNDSPMSVSVTAVTEVFEADKEGRATGAVVATISTDSLDIAPGKSRRVDSTATIDQPQLWGPPPTQHPHRYVAVTTLKSNGKTVDRYETTFGVRKLEFDPDRGLAVNGKHVVIQGVNMHHDLGPLGAAFNLCAAERQLEMLREMGCNAIRMSHNPPAPELLELTDNMGFLVVDEAFDVWQRKKTPLDLHLIFDDWHEQDLRALVRRDRNHPSVIMWSLGNEVGEQYTGDEGAAVAQRLHKIAKQEDPTRPTTIAMNYAKPEMPMPRVPDVISLNYQGEGIRDAPAYEGMPGIRTPPLYDNFHETFPDKMVLSSENAAALSTRGAYLLPVFPGQSAPVKDGMGGDPVRQQVSAYELYTAPFGSSADKVFTAMDARPFVAGGFVWSGWDYLGEPTPYYGARSSYFGIIDLAGFAKDRFYLYQSHWRPDLPMAHILPHWNWPDRVGQPTPVHVFTSGDEAELFVNGESLGKKKKEAGEYRLRWDDATYEPGEVTVVAYKNGAEWAKDIIRTAGPASGIELSADRATITADGLDLVFVSARVTDDEGLTVPTANNRIDFAISGPGEIVATANGDPASMEAFPSPTRKAFYGRCLVVIRVPQGKSGTVHVTARSEELAEGGMVIRAIAPGEAE